MIQNPTDEQMEAALQAERDKQAARESLPDPEEIAESLKEHYAARAFLDGGEFSPRTIAAALRLIVELQEKVVELEARIAGLEYQWRGMEV